MALIIGLRVQEVLMGSIQVRPGFGMVPDKYKTLTRTPTIPIRIAIQSTSTAATIVTARSFNNAWPMKPNRRLAIIVLPRITAMTGLMMLSTSVRKQPASENESVPDRRRCFVLTRTRGRCRLVDADGQRHLGGAISNALFIAARTTGIFVPMSKGF